MQTVTLFDTSVATDNLGDQIIVESVYDVLHEIMPNAFIYTVPTHESMTKVSRSLLKNSELSIVAGTNILSSNMNSKLLWKIDLFDSFFFDHAVLLGCGWFNYQKNTNYYSRMLLRRILSQDSVHSLRDSYAASRVQALGCKAVNTCCPTTWGLTPEHCAKVPRDKSTDALTTLTFYNRAPESDRGLLTLLKDRYRSVHFWPQQREDLEYMLSLGVDGIHVVPPSLKAYDNFLNNNSVDFIGTRLHGGIRALQKLRRALILAIDIRATEIGKDTNLPVVKRHDLDAVQTWIDGGSPLELRLPVSEIARWKGQFAHVR